MVQLSSLKSNPNNPRIIKDAKFKQLVASLKSFPKMMELRPIVIDENSVIKAGNQRLKALKELGYKEIPAKWVKKAVDFTESELNEFMLKDNNHAGEFDWKMLKTDFDAVNLLEWGFIEPEPEESEPEKETVSFTKTKSFFIKIVFKSAEQLTQAEEEIKTLLEKFKGAEYTVSAGAKTG